MSPPAQPLLVSCGDDAARLWRLDGSAVPMAAPAAGATAVRWYPSGKLFAEGTRDGRLVFRNHTGAPIGNFDTHTRPAAVRCLDVSHGSRFLAAGAEDGQLSVWDMKTRSVVNRFEEHGPIVAVAFQNTSDSRYIACATAEAGVALYSRASGRLVERFSVISGKSSSPSSPHALSAIKVTALAFSPVHFNLLVVADDSGCVNVWDITRKQPQRSRAAWPQESGPAPVDVTATHSRFKSPLRTPATDLAFAPAASAVSLCVGGLDKQVRLYDKALKRMLFSISCQAPVTSVSFAADSRHLAAGLSNGAIVVHSLDPVGGNSSVVATIDDAHTAGDGSQFNAVASTAVRTLHFQPKYDTALGSFSSAKNNPTPKPTALRGALGSAVRNREFPREVSFERTTSALSGDPGIKHVEKRMLPGFHAKDPFSRLGQPRDSDIFSPIASRKAPTLRDTSTTGSSSFLETPSHSSHSFVEQVVRSQSFPSRHLNGARVDTSDHFDEPGPHVEAPQLEHYSAPLSGGSLQEEGDPWNTPDVADDGDEDDVDTLLDKSSQNSSGASLGATSIPQREESNQHGGSQASSRSPSARPALAGVLNGPLGVRQPGIRKSVSSDVSPRVKLPPRPPPRSLSSEEVLSSKTRREAYAQNFAEAPTRRTELFSSADGSATPAAVEATAEESDAPIVENDSASKETNTSFNSSHSNGDIPPQASPSGLARQSVENSEGLTWESMCKLMRAVVSEEVEVLRQDVLNIHTEFVVSSAKHADELRDVLKEHDATVDKLRAEVRELRHDNERLRAKYGLG